jgi:hypothetical protein
LLDCRAQAARVPEARLAGDAYRVEIMVTAAQ